jgi:hypothetical protein
MRALAAMTHRFNKGDVLYVAAIGFLAGNLLGIHLALA